MSNSAGGASARGPAPVLVDVATAVRAASTGLSVLLLGGLMTPIAQAYLPVVGQFWLLLVSVVAFAAAGGEVTCLHEADMPRLRELMDAPLPDAERAGIAPSVEALESFARAALAAAAYLSPADVSPAAALAPAPICL